MFRKKLIGFSLIILILIVSIGVVSAQDNTTQILGNSTATPTDEGKTFTDIQMAIDDASENDTIELEGIYSSQGKEIKINKSITISSKNGATLDAKAKSNIFNISNVNVNLNNLNIINSKSKTTSAIYSIGNLTISNSRFANNSVHIQSTYYSFDSEYDTINYTAGAIYSTNALKIINSTFENNFAIRNAYEHEYFEYYTIPWGGSINSKGTLTITKSRFRDNQIESYGNLSICDSEFVTSPITCYAITSIANSTLSKSADFSYALDVCSNVTLTDCNFTANVGYAISGENQVENGNIIITRCNFINNNLRCSGFYDYESDNEFNIESDVIGCDYYDIFIYDSKFENNTESAVFNHAGNLYVLNSAFGKNSAYRGAAIHCNANTTVINSTFYSNAASFAGAIYSSRLTLINSSFSSNYEGAVETDILATIDGENYTGHTFFDNSLEKINLVTMTTQKITTTYQSGKTIYLKMIYTESKNPVKDYNVWTKITNGKKVYYDDIYTNSKGIAYLKVSKLPVGTYKIIFNYDDDDLDPITTTAKITKAKTTIKAPKVTNKYKKSKYFQVTVKNKATKKAVKNTYVKIKIDKKTYKVKTNSKGIAKFNTKKLKIGKHKVTITSGNTNYIMSAKSTIVIKR